jgi:hypothetical protein
VKVNGQVSTTTSATQATADIGDGSTDVTVAATNASGTSAEAPFPVLYNVTVRACGSDTVEVTWQTKTETDTATSFDLAGSPPQTKTCFDPTPRADHQYGDVASCSSGRLTAGTGGLLTPGVTLSVQLLSRDRYGFLGMATESVALPSAGCVCLTSSANLYSGCETIQGCELSGFDLETGAPAGPDASDLYLTETEATNGTIQDVVLHAPNGAVALPNSQFCDVASAPLAGYATTISLGDLLNGYLLTERASTIIVRTSLGRYAKLNVECNCPSSGTPAGMTMMGLRFGWVVSPAGSTSFP